MASGLHLTWITDLFMKDSIFITKADFAKLSHLIEGQRSAHLTDRTAIEDLAQELDRAEIVDPQDVPANVITMNSEVLLKDLDSGEVMRYRLIFPTQVRSGNSISILAPIGTALLGYREGDVIEWAVPRGVRRLQVLNVLSQPEAAGVWQ